MGRRRGFIAVTLSVVVVLVGWGSVVVARHYSEHVDAESARLPAFPPQTDCSSYDGPGELRLDLVNADVVDMLRPTFGRTHVWVGRAPTDTTWREVEEHYAATMPSPLRRDNSFRGSGRHYRVGVWSYDGWFGKRAVAVVFIEDPYAGTSDSNGRDADFRWLAVIDANGRNSANERADAPACGP